MYLLYLIKSKMPLIISYIWLPELLKCVGGEGVEGNVHLELMKYGKFST